MGNFIKGWRPEKKGDNRGQLHWDDADDLNGNKHTTSQQKATLNEKEKKLTLYTIALDDKQMKALEAYCEEQLWESYDVAYARFAYKGNGVNIVAYKSGKLVVQGKKTEDFVKFILEPKITSCAQLGYDHTLHPEWFEAHAGLDESGKGDLFGPLVTACVVADGTAVDSWIAMGLKESKKITSDAVVLEFDKKIRQTKGVVVEAVFAKMEKYNALYEQFKNLNNLLAWMHAKALEGALKKRFVPWGMLDQFSKQPLVQNYFQLARVQADTNIKFDLRMMTKAESDPIVAAASVVARAEYIRQMRKLSKECDENLKKGVSEAVKEQARRIVEKFGPEGLLRFCKRHFKTAYEVLGLPPPTESAFIKRDS